MNLTELQQAVRDAREAVRQATHKCWEPTSYLDSTEIDKHSPCDDALTRYADLAGLLRAIRAVEGLLCEYIGGDCLAMPVRPLREWCRRCSILTALYAEAEKLMEVKA